MYRYQRMGILCTLLAVRICGPLRALKLWFKATCSSLIGVTRLFRMMVQKLKLAAPLASAPTNHQHQGQCHYCRRIVGDPSNTTNISPPIVGILRRSVSKTPTTRNTTTTTKSPAPMSTAVMDRSALVFLARLTEQAERYDEMLQHTTAIATSVDDELSVEERNLLAVAYENVIGSKRAAFRVIEHMQSKTTDATQLARIKSYRETIASEIVAVCEGHQTLVAKRLLPCTSSEEGRIFLHKSMGDYYRYLAEVQEGEQREETVKLGMEQYVKSSTLAMAELTPTHPIRLGLALNFSVFLYETLNTPDKACNLAKQAFDDAIAELDTLSEESYRDSTLVMQLLRDNLTLWTSDQDDDE